MKQVFLYVLIVLSVWACSSEPEPIRYSEDQCAFCKMTIEDPKFGAEIVTAKGRVYKFDAIECLVSALPEYQDVQSILVTPFDRVETLVPVDSVVFLKSDLIRSPMGAGLAAFLDKSNGEPYGDSTQWMRWDEVKTKTMNK